MYGKVLAIKTAVKSEHIKVTARIKEQSGRVFSAGLPDRELSALVPRSILLGETSSAPENMLDVIESILCKAVRGRTVRYWEYQNREYFSFLSWRAVKFIA
ncbi:MAG: hypothetical protein J7K04_00615 [Spirochaetales bacterium]|nr:hypothetical protein [Spirochaetales bacterium]